MAHAHSEEFVKSGLASIEKLVPIQACEESTFYTLCTLRTVAERKEF